MKNVSGTCVETLLPIDISRGKIRYARGIKAGNWIFATGQMATDFQQGIAPEVLQSRLPRAGKPKNEREAGYIFAGLKKVLQSAGSDMPNVVRLDQYYTTWKAVDPYHVARRAAFGTYIPPSTSILQKNLLLKDAEIDVQMIAIIPKEDFAISPVRIAEIDSPQTSGYAPAVCAGDFVFVAGQMATSGRGTEEKIPSEARPVPGYLWRGKQVKLEAEYIIRNRLGPALKASGSSLSNIVKAQVYIRDIEDFPAFNEVWSRHFPQDPPVTTLIPTATPGFAISEAMVEINAIALADRGKTKKEIVRSDLFTGFERQTVAIRAGDLLFISGLMAVDETGLVDGGDLDPRQPFFGSPIENQMDCILRNARDICHAAGTSLENVVRIQQFHTNLEDFYGAYQAWQRMLPERYLPFSAVEVPGPLPVPGAKILVDIWVYAP